jgi:ABC-2 type transport system permease protein
MRGQILGWGIGLGILGGYMTTFYEVFAEQQEQFTKLMESYPPEIMAMFGGTIDLSTPQGFLNVEFFSYMPLILGIFAILNGSGLLVGDEENGRLDLVLSYPINRTGFYYARLGAFLAAALLIILIIWVAFVVALPSTNIDITAWEMVRPFISLLAILIFLGTLALFLSMLLPSRRSTAMITGLILVASFFVNILVVLNKDLEFLADFSPLNYYQGGLAISDLNWEWVGGLLGLSLLFVLLAWWRFERRDIRVGGEGGWGLPSLRRRSEAQEAEAPASD